MMKQFRSMQAYTNFEDGKHVFYSYNSKIIAIDTINRTIELGQDFDYSKTTGKQVRTYFREEWGMNIGVQDLRRAMKKNEKLRGYTVQMNDSF